MLDHCIYLFSCDAAQEVKLSLSPSVCSYPFFSFSVFGVSRKFQGCLKEVSRVLQGSFKGVLRKFQGCFKNASRVFHRGFKDVSRKF